MAPLFRWFSILSVILSLAEFTSANTVQDQQGVGARAKAMGGAGTALASDASASYYNPAALSQCDNSQLSLGLNHFAYDLPVDSDNSDYQADKLSGRSAATVSGCLHLPYRLSLGFLFDTGLSNVQSLNQSALSVTPEYALYGKPLEQISMMGGVSYAVNDKLSLGIGGAVLVNSGLQIAAEIPILSADEEISGTVAWTLKPAAAFYAGIRYQAAKSLTLAAALRTALFHQLQAEARTRVQAAGVLIDVDLLLENVAWYSPLQAAIGASYSLGKRTTFAGDVTWYHYSAHPGPYIHISPLDPGDSVAAGLNYPPVEAPGFHDILVPRMGTEYLLSSSLSLRAGLSYRPTPAPLPGPDKRSNLLDASVVSLSLGGGYRWKIPRSKSGKGISSFELSAYLRVHNMSEQRVSKRMETGETVRYRFGGQMLDSGVTMTAGW